MDASTSTRPSDPFGTRRRQVHLGLIVSFAVALFFLITRMSVGVHVVAGLYFAVMVGVHLAQRRRT